MTLAEAEALLGPALCARLRAKWGPPPPLTPEQIDLCAALLTSDPVDNADAA